MLSNNEVNMAECTKTRRVFRQHPILSNAGGRAILYSQRGEPNVLRIPQIMNRRDQTRGERCKPKICRRTAANLATPHSEKSRADNMAV